MHRLHRGNDAEPGESRNIRRSQMLRVLDAPPQRPAVLAVLPECLLVLALSNPAMSAATSPMRTISHSRTRIRSSSIIRRMRAMLS
jgi:hypothetical protein